MKYFQSYILTPKGISERTKLTLNFMKRKMREYDELKKELENKNKVELNFSMQKIVPGFWYNKNYSNIGYKIFSTKYIKKRYQRELK